MNVWKAIQQELVNIYQFLYNVTLVVDFQVKSWPVPCLWFVIIPRRGIKNGPQTENVYYLESGLLRAKKTFGQLFDIEDNWPTVKFRFYKISTSNEFSNLLRIKIRSKEQVFSALSQDIWKELSIENVLINLSQPKHYAA